MLATETKLKDIINLYRKGLLSVPETLQAITSAIQAYTEGVPDPDTRQTEETRLYRKTLYSLHRAITARERDR